nr:MAG TPA_asm: hypothetical protein [Caudoviricetes sp.]
MNIVYNVQHTIKRLLNCLLYFIKTMRVMLD